MPSRIAFSVASGVDSRTIIDMNGAEKLLGRGDMLFYPSGYPKPIRVQGSYISDEEVRKIVDYLKKRNPKNNSAVRKNDTLKKEQDYQEQQDSSSQQEASQAPYDTHQAQEIMHQTQQETNQMPQDTYPTQIEDYLNGNVVANYPGAPTGAAEEDGRDHYFAEAGFLIIDKEKASIGMLQRMFRIGFNRAARIMDQLHQDGVVSGEEGTKPRNILMSREEFQLYIDEQGIKRN
jgi:S-DNA-T family DNA segregation ATPase FtsK/SpoIIIE